MHSGINWTGDAEFVLDDVSYVCIELPRPETISTPDRFYIIKSRGLVESYERLVLGNAPQNIFEVGIWHGGSTAFLAQLAQPRKLVAVDLNENECMPLRRFIERNQLESSVAPFYGIDQSDAPRLREILAAEQLSGALDLVVDDASHQLEPTRRTFNALFPHVRPGGAYVIEDWSWAHGAQMAALPPTYATRPPLSVLIFQLILLSAYRPDVVTSIEAKKGIAVVRRGPAALDPRTFDISTSYASGGQEMIENLSRPWATPA